MFCSRHLCSRRLRTKVSALPDLGRVRIGPSGDPWISVIGLEVHAQIAASTKLFSGAGAKPAAPVNNQVALLDASIPGTLPSLNRRCVEAGLQTALALNCQINQVSHFDRKHYFYADLPAGYQITQQRRPIARDGRLDFIVLRSATVPKTYSHSVGIVQLQLEQDSGKSLHDETATQSLIDLNRCGMALMEIVFQPDLFDGEEAAALIKELALILQSVGSCTCQMEHGALRVDANISVNRPGEPLGIRTEVKNLNSVRSVVRAIEYEVDRQIGVLESGGVVENETRSFDFSSKRTLTMRDKEAKQDYRFMPEPNLPPLRLADDPSSTTSGSRNILNINSYRLSMPELPSSLRERLLSQFSLTLEAACLLVSSPELCRVFLAAAEYDPISPQTLANLITTDLLGILNELGDTVDQTLVTPKQLSLLSDMKTHKTLPHHIIVQAIRHFHSDDTLSLPELIRSKGWDSLQDPKLVKGLIDDVVKENPKVVRKYLRGKDKMFQELVKQANKKAVAGKLDMAFVAKEMRDVLECMKD